ncbi:hypothetical protein ACYF6T_21310 [Streptomyces sp. 7R007]
MSATPVLRWPMPGPFVDHTSGCVIECPTCRETERLVVAMDLGDHSGEPSYITCPGGHTWPEAGLPRRLAALLLAEVFEAEPGLLADLEALQRVHGSSL